MADHIIENQCQAIGIGDAMVDLFTHSSNLPTIGGNIWSSAVTLIPGGTAANVAANIAKLGISSAFIGCVGDDPYGQYTVDEFKKVGVDTSGIIFESGSYTGIVLGIITGDGERTFIACARGAAHTLLSREIVKNIRYHQGQIVHASGVCLVESPSREGLLAALESAHKNGNQVYFDPNLRLEGSRFTKELYDAQWQAIRFSDVVLIGEEEIKLMCEDRSLADGADILRKEGPKLIVVKQGDKGAVAFNDQGKIISPAFKVPVLSMAGAGDSFDAGFISARIRGANLQDAMIYANAVAAIKVTRQGARAVPDHIEVMVFLGERGIQLHLQ